MTHGNAIAGKTAGAGAHALTLCAHLALLALIYSQTRSFDYVYFDDADYVLENPAVLGGLTGDGMRWAFTSFYMSNWHPLTWLSHMLDVSLAGPAPGWPHLHNALLHGVNSLLVYLLLLRWSGSWAKAAALSIIFLVHPLHVESVAWIAERKDLLCALFFILGLICYDAYQSNRSWRGYLQVLLCFMLALMAKPMAVTFPAVLLLLDVLIYRRTPEPGSSRQGTAGATAFSASWLPTLLEKLPLFALAAASSAVTILAQDAGGSLAYVEAHSIAARLETASVAYLIYLKQWLLPVQLAAFYPVDAGGSIGRLLGAMALLLLLATIALRRARSTPLVLAGLAVFLATLLPVIGLIQVGAQAHADRYMYLPSIGLLMICITLLPERGHKQFPLAAILTTIFIAYLTVLCYWQVAYWKNEHTLFSRVVHVVGPNYKAYIHLAQDYIRRGMLDQARETSLAAMTLQPQRSDAYQALGNIALAEQDFKTAEFFFRNAVKRGPLLANVLNNLGIALAEQGKLQAGIKAFEQALRLDPALQAAAQNRRHYQAQLSAGTNP